MRFFLYQQINNLFQKIIYYISNITIEAGRQIKVFGIIFFINYPLYYIIWKYGSTQAYENLPLRIVASLFCIPLIFNDKWQEKYKLIFLLYWFGTVTFCLPFFFLYMTLQNHGSAAWLLNLLLEILLTFLLFDLVGVIIVNFIGFAAAIFIYCFIQEFSIVFIPSSIDFFGALGTIVATFVIGGIFAHNRERIEQAKYMTMRMIGANIAHELRTPLASIELGIGGAKKYLPVLLNGYELAKNNGLPVMPINSRHLIILNALLSDLEKEAQYSQIIINMILMNTKQSLIPNNNFKVYSIKGCVEDAIHRYPFKDNQLDLIKYNKDYDFLFNGDALLLQHIIFNLLKNALYAIESVHKGEINIWCKKINNKNLLFFKDSAKGVSDNIIANLFEKFYTTSPDGTGLGLAFCKAAMKSMNGDITVDSEPGSYCLFKLTFPIINQKVIP